MRQGGPLAVLFGGGGLSGSLGLVFGIHRVLGHSHNRLLFLVAGYQGHRQEQGDGHNPLDMCELDHPSR